MNTKSPGIAILLGAAFLVSCAGPAAPLVLTGGGWEAYAGGWSAPGDGCQQYTPIGLDDSLTLNIISDGDRWTLPDTAPQWGWIDGPRFGGSFQWKYDYIDLPVAYDCDELVKSVFTGRMLDADRFAIVEEDEIDLLRGSAISCPLGTYGGLPPPALPCHSEMLGTFTKVP